MILIIFSSSYITQEFKEVILKIQFSVISNIFNVHQMDNFGREMPPEFEACAIIRLK